MDDKQFDEIMNKYVSSTANSAENDFKEVKKYSQKQKRNFVLKWSSIAVSICIILSMSIILPIALSTGDKQGATIQYLDNELILQEQTDNINNLSSLGMIDYLEPKIISSKQFIYILSNKENLNEIVGADINLIVESNDFENVVIGICYKQYELQKYNNYSTCINESIWEETGIKWISSYNEFDEIYLTKIIFSYDKYNYFIEAETYDQLTPIEILDKIY